MYRIRFHGRGGQGMKTASRILGTAFFLAGFEVQDAPRYGAERRGAPIFAYVRADKHPINERGVISLPDLVAVADESLVALPTAGVTQGLGESTVLLIHSAEDPATWQHRLNLAGPVLTLPPEAGSREPHAPAARVVGAASRLLGCFDIETLCRALTEELSGLGEEALAASLETARDAFAQMASHQGLVREGSTIAARGYAPPTWIDLAPEPARMAAPAIHAPATSVAVHTGLWRTRRPEINYHRCNRCWWLCSTFCPESAITVAADRSPAIDYDHCKGCMVCVTQCPTHAIEVRPEHSEGAREGERP